MSLFLFVASDAAIGVQAVVGSVQFSWYSTYSVFQGLNPLGFGAGLLPFLTWKCEDDECLNPLGFGAGLLPFEDAETNGNDCLNPLGFGAGLLPSRKPMPNGNGES